MEKVNFLQGIKNLQSKECRNAEMALFCGQPQDGENILLQSGQHFRAIQLNMQQAQWERALDLAVKHKTHVDTVIGYRTKYLGK